MILPALFLWRTPHPTLLAGLGACIWGPQTLCMLASSRTFRKLIAHPEWECSACAAMLYPKLTLPQNAAPLRPLLFLCETGAWRMLAGRSSQSASGAMQGKIDRVGSYCPLDLYSGEAAKVSRAFAALLADPQNNLRIFRNGSPLPFRWTPVPE